MIARDSNGHVILAGVTYEQVLETYPDLTHLANYVIDEETDEVISEGTIEDLVLEWSENDVHSRALKLLSESDWVVTRSKERNLDVPLEWKSYRDELRALVDWQINDELTWPTKPSA